jgi:WD40 repeat protein
LNPALNSTPILQPRAQLNLGEFPVDAAFSADGSTLVVAGGEGSLFSINLRGTAAGVRFGEHQGGVLAVAGQPGGALFASSGQDGEVRIWDLRDGSVRCIHVAGQWSEHIAFSGNGKLLAVANGRRLRLFTSAGEEQATVADHPGNIAALAWRPKLNEVAAASNGGVRLHRMGTPVHSRDYAWQGACLTASWRPDGSVLASGLQDGTVHYWNIAAGSQSEMKGYGARVAHTSWSGNGKYLATAADPQIVVWEFSGRGPEGSAPIELRAHSERITQLCFQPKGPYLASGARDRRLLLWRPGFSPDPVDADLLGEEIVLLRWSPDGKGLVAGDRNGQTRVFLVA